VIQARGRKGLAAFFTFFAVFFAVAAVTSDKDRWALAALTLWAAWSIVPVWRGGFFASPSGVRMVRTPGIMIFMFPRTLRLSWHEVDRFEFRPGGRASYFGNLIRASDERAFPIDGVVYPRDEHSRLYARLHAPAQRRLDELNTMLQAAQTADPRSPAKATAQVT